MDKPTVKYLQVSADDAGMRLDNYILKYCKGIPKTRIYKAIRSGEVRVDKKRAKPLAKLCCQQSIRLPPWNMPVAVHKNIKKNPVAEWIIYEDEVIIALNKPDHIAVHAGTKQAYGLVDIVSDHIKHKCYLVHRLDKAVSGVILLSKTRQACKSILEKWHDNRCIKSYQALVFGELNDNCILNSPLADKKTMAQTDKNYQSAVTHLHPSASNAQLTLTDIVIETGRYHQIRRHLAAAHLPIVGDTRYGLYSANREFAAQHKLKGLWLHAQSIEFWHPKKQWYKLSAPWPYEKNNWIQQAFTERPI